MTELNPGDIVEIAVGDRKAYAQVTHRHSSYPSVVRAVAGLYDERPGDLADLVAAKTRFVAMIPLATALERAGASFTVLGNTDLPEDQRDFPIFRMPIRDKQGEIVYWWFWDGRSLSYDVELTSAQETLPMREVMTGARFLERLARQGDS